MPIFIKDENSVYIYINQPFMSFIGKISNTSENILNQNTNQVLNGLQARDTVIKHDKSLLSMEGSVKSFFVPIENMSVHVMKQCTKLRDGKMVIAGALIDGF
eukprot:TRINITY_DN7167_c0_g1_i2.p1 TRINITY_DN7167_c0_g1~~TRINITY_DN7167_c0_g1_i2.p1  ORF type:complete len:102 (+),score=12.46 TRINITY_DN7167_c0_g1_i2:403-708(+)